MLIKIKNKLKAQTTPDDLALLVFASQYDKERDAVLCNYTGRPLRFRIAARCKYRIPKWENRLCGNVDHIIPKNLCGDHPELYDDFMNLQYIVFDVNQFDKNDELTLHAQWNATERGIWHPYEAKMRDQLRRLGAGEKIGGYVPREWMYKSKMDLGFPPMRFQLLAGRLFRMGDFSRRFPQFEEVIHSGIDKYTKRTQCKTLA